LTRVHAESTEPTARAAVEALAGLPHFDQVWAGDLRLSLQIVVVASGDRVPGVEFARRAHLLRQRAASLSGRAKGEVQVLQLALYDRQVPPEERQFVVENARVAPWWPPARQPICPPSTPPEPPPRRRQRAREKGNRRRCAWPAPPRHPGGREFRPPQWQIQQRRRARPRRRHAAPPRRSSAP